MTSLLDTYLRATGRPPYPYQVALAEAAALPELLTVPTGCGKTAAVFFAWYWRRRHDEHRTRTPRRLVLVQPVRTLVTQALRVVEGWLAALGGEEVGVHALLGGEVSRAWIRDPERDAVLIGTQDQLLSRALNRGYAASPYLWPVHFGLLHNDCWWVYDETQLMGPALSTSAQLEALRRELGAAVPCCSTWMSATQGPGRLATVDLRRFSLRALTLGEEDRAHPALARRLSAPKRLERLAAGADLAEEALRRHRPGARTLVVANRVSRAIEVYEGIVRKSAKRGIAVRLVHGQFRPGERRAAEAEALAEGFDGIVVATQAIEAGVDVSARVFLTELAPWPSLVQRFGRCNRAGEWEDATAVVVEVPAKDAPPYAPEELAHAGGLLDGLADVGPASLPPLPDGEPVRPVLRRRDLLELFDTEPDLGGRHLDVARYLRDGDERDVQIAWRALDERGPAAEAPALQQGELCRVGIGAARKLLKEQAAWRWSGQLGAWERVPVAYGALRLVPGEAYLVDVRAGGYRADLGFSGDPAHRPDPVGVTGAPNDADDADRLATGFGRYVTLRDHSRDVERELGGLLDALGLPPDPALATAALWHDVGKAAPPFQELLLAGEPREGGPWAKSDGRRGPRPPKLRRAFRHELVSALAWLDQGGDDLTAYLIAAHHGKVRVRLRSRPGERPDGDRPDEPVVLGVCTGDVLPEVDLGDGVRVPSVVLSTELAGLGAEGGSWSDRVLRLLESHGPFRLAWWESLVRIADWRGSRRGELPDPSGGGEAPLHGRHDGALPPLEVA